MRCPYCWRKLARKGQRQVMTVLLQDTPMCDNLPYSDVYACTCRRSDAQIWDELGDVILTQVVWPDVRTYLPALFSWSWKHKHIRRRWYAWKNFWHNLFMKVPAYHRYWSNRFAWSSHEQAKPDFQG